MKQVEKTHEVVAAPRRHFFILDNELMDLLAAEIGIFALGVYALLTREAESTGSASLSLRQISGRLAVSKNSATNALETLMTAGLVKMVPPKEVNASPKYVLVHAKDVVAERGSFPRDSQGRPENRTQVRSKRVLNEGHAVSLNKDASGSKTGHERPENRTPNKEENKDQNKNKTEPPPTPSGGAARMAGTTSSKGKSEAMLDALLAKGRARRPVAGNDAEFFTGAWGGVRTDRLELAQVRAAFNGVMDEVRRALYDISLAGGPKGHKNLVDGAEEYKRYFADVVLEEMEAAEGSEDRMVLVLRAGNAAVSRAGFVKYSTRIERELKKFFGPVVPQVRWATREEAMP